MNEEDVELFYLMNSKRQTLRDWSKLCERERDYWRREYAKAIEQGTRTALG